MTARASFESRLRELLAEGTPGPWHDGWQGHGTDETYMVWSSKSADLVCATSCLKRGYEDAELIVAAVNALPKLLECVDLLREAEYAGAWTTPQIDAWNAKRDTLLASLETETQPRAWARLQRRRPKPSCHG